MEKRLISSKAIVSRSTAVSASQGNLIHLFLCNESVKSISGPFTSVQPLEYHSFFYKRRRN